MKTTRYCYVLRTKDSSPQHDPEEMTLFKDEPIEDPAVAEAIREFRSCENPYELQGYFQLHTVEGFEALCSMPSENL